MSWSSLPPQLSPSALDLFVSLDRSEAGNLALKIMATGGVYLGGEIASRLLINFAAQAF